MRRARDRRPAPLPRGHPGLAHPLAHGGPTRRDARAAADRRRWTRRPLIVLDALGAGRRGGARQGGARRGVAVRPPRPRGRLRASCCRATGARSRSGATWPAGPACTPGSRWSRAARRRRASTLGAARRRGDLGDRRRRAWAPRAALERMPAGARILVAPVALPGARPLFEVAGCTGCLVERGAPAGWRRERGSPQRPAAARRARRPERRGDARSRRAAAAGRLRRAGRCSPAPTGWRWSTPRRSGACCSWSWSRPRRPPRWPRSARGRPRAGARRA